MLIRTHVGVSVDGFISGPDGLPAWDSAPGWDHGTSHGYAEFNAGNDDQRRRGCCGPNLIDPLARLMVGDSNTIEPGRACRRDELLWRRLTSLPVLRRRRMHMQVERDTLKTATLTAASSRARVTAHVLSPEPPAGGSRR